MPAKWASKPTPADPSLVVVVVCSGECVNKTAQYRLLNMGKQSISCKTSRLMVVYLSSLQQWRQQLHGFGNESPEKPGPCRFASYTRSRHEEIPSDREGPSSNWPLTYLVAVRSSRASSGSFRLELCLLRAQRWPVSRFACEALLRINNLQPDSCGQLWRSEVSEARC